MAKKICPFCSHRAEVDVVECPVCGMKIPDDAIIVEDIPIPVVEPEPEPEPMPIEAMAPQSGRKSSYALLSPWIATLISWLPTIIYFFLLLSLETEDEMVKFMSDNSTLIAWSYLICGAYAVYAAIRGFIRRYQIFGAVIALLSGLYALLFGITTLL